MELADFDVTRNLPQDLMHVLLEGVFPYHLEQLLNYVVNELSLLTISQINSRVLDFPYAYFSEKPSALNNLSLMGTQSATQMWQLFHILPFVIGSDMPNNDPHYECFMMLTDMASILFSPIIAKGQIPFLRLLIKEYLERFTTLYPGRPLTPKFHYLVHTPSLILRYTGN